MSSAQEILAGYEGLQADQEAFYKDLHQHPELSHQEHRTAHRVAGQLQQYRCTVQDGIGGTGACSASPARPNPWTTASAPGRPSSSEPSPPSAAGPSATSWCGGSPRSSPAACTPYLPW